MDEKWQITTYEKREKNTHNKTIRNTREVTKN